MRAHSDFLKPVPTRVCWCHAKHHWRHSQTQLKQEVHFLIGSITLMNLLMFRYKDCFSYNGGLVKKNFWDLCQLFKFEAPPESRIVFCDWRHDQHFDIGFIAVYCAKGKETGFLMVGAILYDDGYMWYRACDSADLY